MNRLITEILITNENVYDIMADIVQSTALALNYYMVIHLSAYSLYLKKIKFFTFFYYYSFFFKFF